MGRKQSRPVEDGRRVMTVKQMAEALQVAEVTIRGWIAERRIAVIRINRSVRVPISEVDRVMEAGMVPAARERGKVKA